MATVGAKAIRSASVDQRIETATEALAQHFGITVDDPSVFNHRDPTLKQIVERERLADLLEAVAVASGAAPEEQEPDGPNLSRMKRDELNVYALDHGVDDPESYRTKDELIAAIEGAEQESAPELETGVEIEQDGTPVIVTEAESNPKESAAMNNDPKNPQPEPQPAPEPVPAPEPNDGNDEGEGE